MQEFMRSNNVIFAVVALVVVVVLLNLGDSLRKTWRAKSPRAEKKRQKMVEDKKARRQAIRQAEQAEKEGRGKPSSF